MNSNIIVSIAAVVVGIGGTLVTLASWSKARKRQPSEARPSSYRIHLARRPFMPAWFALTIIVAIGVAIIAALVAGPVKLPSPKGMPGLSVAASAVLLDPGSRGAEDVAFSPDSNYFATVDLNGAVYVWSTATRTLAATLPAAWSPA